MALSINNYPISINPSYYINTISGNLSETVERLSTGLRINNAGDDPAGYFISEKLRVEMAAIGQGIRNAQDAVSLLQTADSGLDIIDEKLTRMKELAEQAATGTYTDSQRLIMQSEFSVMGSEIDRIANETEFNTIKLLNGDLKSTSTWSSAGGWVEANSGLRVHFGSTNQRSEDYYYINIAGSRTSDLFSSTNISISTQPSAQTALAAVNTAISNKDNIQSWVGALQNRLEGTINDLEGKYESYDYGYNQITNIDVADEITDFVIQSVLLQSAIAVTAQANLFPQMVLELISNI